MSDTLKEYFERELGAEATSRLTSCTLVPEDPEKGITRLEDFAIEHRSQAHYFRQEEFCRAARKYFEQRGFQCEQNDYGVQVVHTNRRFYVAVSFAPIDADRNRVDVTVADLGPSFAIRRDPPE